MPDLLSMAVHPMLVHFPIAMLSAAWVCLVVRYAVGDLRWDDRVHLFETVGVAFLVPTMIAGFVDARGIGFILRPRFDQPMIWHFIAAVLAAAAFGAHWAWRRRRRGAELVGPLAVQDLGLATVGMIALLAAGMIGGEMVHGA